MADNVTANPGTGGAVFASDDIGGVQYPKEKIVFGPDDSFTDVTTATPFPVQLRSSGGTELATAGAPLRIDPTGTTTQPISAASLPLPAGASTSANQTTEITSLQLLDDVIKTDDAAFTPGTDKVSMIGAEFDDTTPDSVDEGDAGALRMSGNRNLYTQLRDAAGNERGANVTAANALVVDGSAVTQPVSAVSLPLPAGAATSANQTTEITSLQLLDDVIKTDDAAFTPGTDKVSMIGAEFDDTTPDSVDEGDAGALRMSANRNLYTQIRDAAGNERGVNVTAGNALVVDGSAVTQPISATTLPLPTGASTSANQTTEITSLQLIDDVIKTDDAAFTPGTDKVAMIGAEFDNTTPDSVDEGDAGALRMSGNRNLYTQIRDAAGNERGVNVTPGNELLVAGSLYDYLNSIAGQQEAAATEETLPATAVQAINPTLYQGSKGFVRVADLMEKTRTSEAITAGGTTVTITVASTAGLNPGDYVLLTGGTDELLKAVTVTATQITFSAVNGSAHTTAIWDSFSTTGPGSNQVNPWGVSSHSLVMADPLSIGSYFLATAARLDALANQSVLSSAHMLFNGTNFDRAREVVNGQNTIGTGIQAAGILGQFDDVAPTSITENQFGDVRISANRNLYTTIRDAAGNERGVNVTAANALTVDGSAVTQPVSAVTLPLPTGAATSANQTTEITSLQLIDDIIKTDDASFTPGTDKVAMIGAEFDDTAPDSVDEGDAGALRMSGNRNLYSTIRDAAGNERGVNVTAGNALTIDGSAVTQPISAASLPLPTGAATSANQTTEITSLQLIDDIVKIEDAVHGSGDSGVMALAVRRDANSTLVDTTGDYAPLQVDATGSLKVAIISGAGSGGTSMTDDAAFTPATSEITPMGAFFDDTAPDSVDEGDGGVVRMSGNRNLYTQLRDAAGNERGVNVTAGNALTVDGSAVTQPISAASLPLPTGAATAANQTTEITSLQLIDDVIKTDDTAFTPATDKVAMIGAEFDDTAPDSVDEGDAGALRMSANRNLYGTIRDAAGNERGVNVTAGNALVVDGSAVTQPVSAVSLPLPTGAATSANQTTEITSLQIIDDIVKIEDVAHGSGDSGVMALSVRRDANSTLVDTDGDYAPLQVDATGSLKVAIISGAGSGGTSMVDDAAFTPATTQITPMGAFFDDAAPDSVNEGDGGVVRMSANRNLYGTIRDAAGNERGVNVTAGNALVVDGSAVTQPVSGTVAISGTVPVSIAATVTVDTELPAAAALADATANPTTPLIGANLEVFNGTTWDRAREVVNAQDTTGTGILASGILGQFDDTATGTVTENQFAPIRISSRRAVMTEGVVAHDVATTANPVIMGARANANEPTAVSTDGDVTHLWADLLGRLVVIPGHPNPEAPVTVNATASGNTTVIAAPGASLSLYIVSASIHNRASTNRLVILQDGAGGTNRFRAEIAAEGGGTRIEFGARGWKLTANTLLNVNLDAAGNIDVNITEYYIAA